MTESVFEWKCPDCSTWVVLPTKNIPLEHRCNDRTTVLTGVLSDVLTCSNDVLEEGGTIGGEERQDQDQTPRRRKSKSYTTEFESWWSVYPRRDDKARAFRAFQSVLRTGVPVDVLIEGARRYAADKNREEQFTKLASTWLNSGSYDNGPLPARSSSSRSEPKSPYEAEEEYRAWAERYAETGEA